MAQLPHLGQLQQLLRAVLCALRRAVLGTIRLLLAACKQRDDIVKLEAVVERDGVTTTGSTGQVVTHPAVAECRQGRLALGRLLGLLKLPEEEEQAQGPASKRSQKAAQARWNREATMAERRAG